MNNDEEYVNAGATLPDYQNVRNVIFHNWEEFNNSVVNFRLCPFSEYDLHKREVQRTYLRFFAQINDKSKLANLKPVEKKILQYYNSNPNKFTFKSSKVVQDITRKLMSEYGIFNLETNTDDYL